MSTTQKEIIKEKRVAEKNNNIKEKVSKRSGPMNFILIGYLSNAEMAKKTLCQKKVAIRIEKKEYVTKTVKQHTTTTVINENNVHLFLSRVWRYSDMYIRKLEKATN